MAQWVDNLPGMQEIQVMRAPFLGREDSLEKQMATHSSVLAWRIPWIDNPDGLQFTGLQRVRHNLATEHSLLTPEKSYSSFC